MLSIFSGLKKLTDKTAEVGRPFNSRDEQDPNATQLIECKKYTIKGEGNYCVIDGLSPKEPYVQVIETPTMGCAYGEITRIYLPASGKVQILTVNTGQGYVDVVTGTGSRDPKVNEGDYIVAFGAMTFDEYEGRTKGKIAFGKVQVVGAPPEEDDYDF